MPAVRWQSFPIFTTRTGVLCNSAIVVKCRWHSEINPKQFCRIPGLSGIHSACWTVQFARQRPADSFAYFHLIVIWWKRIAHKKIGSGWEWERVADEKCNIVEKKYTTTRFQFSFRSANAASLQKNVEFIRRRFLYQQLTKGPPKGLEIWWIFYFLYANRYFRRFLADFWARHSNCVHGKQTNIEMRFCDHSFSLVMQVCWDRRSTKMQSDWNVFFD